MASLKTPVTIAGGGLAGLSLACGLGLRGIRATVHEAGRYPRHRVCGEFISGVTAATLAELGIADLLADARRLESLAWLHRGRMVLEDRLPVAAWGISRHRLDARLAMRARQGVAEVIEGSRLAPDAGPGRVWAAGRAPVRGRWLGLKLHIRELPLLADLEMHLGENGYVGLAGIEDGQVNVCGLFRVERSRRGEGAELLHRYLLAGGHGELVERLQAAIPVEDSFRAVAGFEPGRQARKPGLLALGDAESMIPPFTGNGMSMAFQSAALALEPLSAWAQGEADWATTVATVDRRLRQTFRKRLAAAAVLHSLLLHPLGRDLLDRMAQARVLPFRPVLALVR